jgi:FkbM family methyltransferase
MLHSRLTRRLIEFLARRVAVLVRAWEHPLNSGSRVDALRDYFLWNLMRFTMRAKYVVSLPHGLEIILTREENYGSGVYVHALYDFTEMLFLVHLLREGDLFLDVGANVGMYSLLVAGITGAEALALEPVSRTFEALNKNIRLNNLENLIASEQTAVGDAAGSVVITSDEGGMNHIVEVGIHGKSERVPLVAIDELLARDDAASTHGMCAMKMDVEGFELKALRGAQNSLRGSNLRAVIIELQNVTLEKYATSAAEVSAFFAENGFFPHSYDPFNRDLSPGTLKKQANQIFIKFDDEIVKRLKSAQRIALPGYPSGV